MNDSRPFPRRWAVFAGISAILVASSAARGQERRRSPTIGFLSSRAPEESADVVDAFRRGLREAGFVEGQNLELMFLWADGHYDRLPALATKLVEAKVDMIFAAGGPPSALAAKAATSTIPIVFSAARDPVGIGLVASLGRPGGNITGMSTLNSQLNAKAVQLLRDLLPRSTAMTYLLNPDNPGEAETLKNALAAAAALGVKLTPAEAVTEEQLDVAFADMAKAHTEALIVSAEPFFDSRRSKIVGLAARYAIPAIYGWRENVLAGGLMSYGNRLPELYREAALYAGRILKGEKPANLPVKEPTKFELVINLKTARALGIEIPTSLVARADEVIE